MALPPWRGKMSVLEAPERDAEDAMVVCLYSPWARYMHKRVKTWVGRSIVFFVDLPKASKKDEKGEASSKKEMPPFLWHRFPCPARKGDVGTES